MADVYEVIRKAKACAEMAALVTKTTDPLSSGLWQSLKDMLDTADEKPVKPVTTTSLLPWRERMYILEGEVSDLKTQLADVRTMIGEIHDRKS